jgi:hypothetical protein
MDNVDKNARAAQRKRILKRGILLMNARHTTLDCSVRDLSEGGARLVLDDASLAPDTFELMIELDGLEAPCQVVWRRRTEVGVKFTAPPRFTPPTRKQVISAVIPQKRASLRLRK